MIANNLEELAGLIKQERETLLASWREQVRQLPSAEHFAIPVPTPHIRTCPFFGSVER